MKGYTKYTPLRLLFINESKCNNLKTSMVVNFHSTNAIFHNIVTKNKTCYYIFFCFSRSIPEQKIYTIIHNMEQQLLPKEFVPK